jgi:hypothetical protein
MWSGLHPGQVLLAFDTASVSGGVFEGPKIRSFAHVPLTAGALVASSFEANLVRADEVLAALRAVAERLEGAKGRVRVLLPSGVARIMLLDGAPRGVDARDLARFRLAKLLPYAEAEAVVDAVKVGRNQFLGAGVRKSIVEGYEAVLSRAGILKDRIDLAPVAALSGLLARAAGAGPCADLILGDAAASCAVSGSGRLLAFRTRLRERSADEPERLAREVERTAQLGGAGTLRRIRVVGPGATHLVGAFLRRGLPAEPGWEAARTPLPLESSEIPWLGAAVA